MIYCETHTFVFTLDNVMQSRYLHIYAFYRLTFVARPSWVQCIQVCSIRSSQWSSALLIQTVKIIVPFKIFFIHFYKYGLYCLEQMKMEECWGKWQRRRDYLGRNFSNAWHPARFSTNPRATTNLSVSTEQPLAGNFNTRIIRSMKTIQSDWNVKG